MNRLILLSAAWLGASAAALAQTPEVPRPTQHVVKPVAKPHRQAGRKSVPVVAPHRAPVRRPPAHVAPVKVPPKPAPKPVVPKKQPVPADVGTNTGLHLPRYATLKTDDVNMRTGPGERYPVLWQYQRRDLPVRIEREFDVWRLVEDMDGIKGWVHQATLTGRRGFVVTGTEDRTMRAEASDTGEAVAVLKPGVIGRVRACDAAAAWCQVQVQDLRGWLKRDEIWGVESGEAVAP